MQSCKGIWRAVKNLLSRRSVQTDQARVRQLDLNREMTMCSDLPNGTPQSWPIIAHDAFRHNKAFSSARDERIDHCTIYMIMVPSSLVRTLPYESHNWSPNGLHINLNPSFIQVHGLITRRSWIVSELCTGQIRASINHTHPRLIFLQSDLSYVQFLQ